MAKKGKNNKKGGDYWDDEFEEDAPAAEEFGTPAETPDAEDGSAEPQAAGADDVADDFLSNLRRAKDKKQEKAKKKEEEEESKKNQQQKGPIIKSKKEKEKEKKEKEKQRKKLLADRKKASGNNDNNKSNETSPAPEEKQEEAKPAPVSNAAKKGKKQNAAIAMLRKQMELKKQLEEEQRLLDEEEARKEEEEKAKIEAEEQAKEEARLAKKEKERLKKEQLKAEGKYLTKKQKQEKALQERRRQQLLASGVTVAGIQNKDTEAAQKPKKVVYGSKKKKKSTPEEEAAAAAAKLEKEKAAAAAKDGEEELLDDWEQLALDDDEPLADSWEAALEEEEEKPQDDDDEDDEEDDDEEEAEEDDNETKKAQEAAAAAAARKAEEEKAAIAKANAEKEKAALKEIETIKKPAEEGSNLRSPICCILGHVDTGKTKLLDKIRQTNVQGGEAGGITQQIGATYFPVEAIKQKTAVMTKYEKTVYEVPGLLIIDTPGHESFTNLRSRGSSLCNIAILVIDIMHGLEQQTLESIRLLRERKAPFIVALNKIDRLYDWKTIPNNSFRDSYEKQSKSVQQEFETKFTNIKVALAEQGLNSELYFQNPNMAKYVSIVPTSAVTGEGVPDLLWLLLELTQKRMSKQLKYLSHVEATILEVKVIEGLGTTIDVVLSNGILREGDRVVLCGMNGPIVTNIRALLTPQPLRELRVKSEYVHHKEVKAALGVKIAANDLEKAVAGSRLLVVGPEDDEDELMDDVMDDLTGLLDSVDTSGRGVVVQASTLGSLEALLDFLKDMKIPVMSIGLGPVYKRDVMKATAMLEKAPELAIMLCFDVKVDKEAEQYAEEQGVKIFNADIIYHLFDSFVAYQKKLMEERRKTFAQHAVYPCVLKTLQIINKRGPMIIGVDVVEGSVRIGTPICAVRIDPATREKTIMLLGTVVSLEVNHQSKDIVKKGQTNAGVAMRLEAPSGQQPTWGRHVDENDGLYSMISRRTIDTLKDSAFRDTVPRDDWLLIRNLKSVLDIK
ncbi:hypothetical protein B5S31_g898 [[Candida] boidinii]|nr:hypothetical protein B5S31_g898 [[Candida] boidinii]OWB77318.1 hypothetical protein B5S32_g1480 [[Candida] boidinii]